MTADSLAAAGMVITTAGCIITGLGLVTPSRALLSAGLWVTSAGVAAVAAGRVVGGDLVLAMVDAVFAGVLAWLAWGTRPPRRRRRPSRVAARVKDLGHRLAEVPATGGAR